MRPRLDGAVGPVDDQPLDPASHAGGDVVPARRIERAGNDAADAAEADNGDAAACGRGGVDQLKDIDKTPPGIAVGSVFGVSIG